MAPRAKKAAAEQSAAKQPGRLPTKQQPASTAKQPTLSARDSDITPLVINAFNRHLEILFLCVFCSISFALSFLFVYLKKNLFFLFLLICCDCR